ncbi:acyltransferase [Bifidobacterium sp. ESL0798]|uniref:acyltransferase n=1 Tax=Bifidobacterium sp. ESL0798 TaxID=2983235 RepID=UPI0023F9DF23|nr:acyltransferase [Bifidobacterium sp. ESL0798]WEV74825.1 acyltransferase [Bifidobacterium sp. ESL0798]
MKKRDVALDFIRFVAISLVVIVHAATITVPDAHVSVFQTFGSFGVPLFVILTGYLMLDRQYDAQYLQKFLKRNLLPMFVCLEVWNAIWYVLARLSRSPFSFKYSLKIALFMQVPDGPFWFLPMIFCLYIGIPLVSVLLNYLLRSGKRNYLYILIGCLLLAGTIIPTVENVHMLFTGRDGIVSVLQMNIFGSSCWCDSVWMLYLIIGFVLKRFSGFIRKRLSSLVCLLSFIVCLVLLLAFRLLARQRHLQDPYFYSNILVVGCATFFFVLMYRFCKFEGKYARKFITLFTPISRFSFGMYMIHTWILAICVRWLTGPSASLGKGYLLFFIVFILSYAGSVLSTWILSTVPGLRKWLLLMK